ncbi:MULTISPECIES: integrase family protein [Roseobacteraceae]|uniref:tyrosine-type recombinase/integrase n=1 Tax=Roseobacteraceae TaxID=2854170 RepID=UPI002B266C34|nr:MULTISPECIES: integrase family protein [Roseobacteraceae]
MKIRLTDLAVRKLSLREQGQVTYWDVSTPGFGLRCSARSKSYVVMYGPRRQLKTLGRFPDLALADARKVARQFLATFAETPYPEQRYTYAPVREAFLEDCKTRLRPSTCAGYKLYLKRIQFSGYLDDISPSQAIKAIKRLSNSPSSQNHGFTALKVFFGWACNRQYMERNPLADLRRPHKVNARERVLSEEEVASLLDHTLGARDRYHDIVTLLLLTGQRRGEIANLQWGDIEPDLITLPSERTKNHKRHAFPIGPRTAALLESIIGGEHHVFGETYFDVPYSGWSKGHRRLLKKTGLKHFTLHDLRRTFSTIHAILGTPIHVTERLLNHSSGTLSGVAAIYNRYDYKEEMRAAQLKYEDYIASLTSDW